MFARVRIAVLTARVYPSRCAHIPVHLVGHVTGNGTWTVTAIAIAESTISTAHLANVYPELGPANPPITATRIAIAAVALPTSIAAMTNALPVGHAARPFMEIRCAIAIAVAPISTAPPMPARPRDGRAPPVFTTTGPATATVVPPILIARSMTASLLRQNGSVGKHFTEQTTAAIVVVEPSIPIAPPPQAASRQVATTPRAPIVGTAPPTPIPPAFPDYFERPCCA